MTHVFDWLGLNSPLVPDISSAVAASSLRSQQLPSARPVFHFRCDIAERHDVDSIAGQRDRLEIVYVVADIEHNSWLELTSCSPDVYFVICAFQIVLVLRDHPHHRNIRL